METGLTDKWKYERKTEGWSIAEKACSRAQHAKRAPTYLHGTCVREAGRGALRSTGSPPSQDCVHRRLGTHEVGAVAALSLLVTTSRCL